MLKREPCLDVMPHGTDTLRARKEMTVYTNVCTAPTKAQSEDRERATQPG